eukprot:1142382-Pelagomonas_calceolata.AAC.6
MILKARELAASPGWLSSGTEPPGHLGLAEPSSAHAPEDLQSSQAQSLLYGSPFAICTCIIGCAWRSGTHVSHGSIFVICTQTIGCARKPGTTPSYERPTHAQNRLMLSHERFT